MSISCTESVLRTQQAKDAIYEGIATLIFTGDLDKACNTMIARGKKNGSYLAVKIAFVLDFINALGNRSRI